MRHATMLKSLQKTDELTKSGLGLQSYKRQFETVSQLLKHSEQEVAELYHVKSVPAFFLRQSF